MRSILIIMLLGLTACGFEVKLPIKVKISPLLTQEQLEGVGDAANLWSDALGQTAADLEVIQGHTNLHCGEVHLYIDNDLPKELTPDPGRLGYTDEPPMPHGTGDKMCEKRIRINFAGLVGRTKAYWALIIAHELGHVLLEHWGDKNGHDVLPGSVMQSTVHSGSKILPEHVDHVYREIHEKPPELAEK